MPRHVYTYTINVLKKVSFDPNLFQKELEKASKKLLPLEYRELMIWVKDHIKNKPVLQTLVL